MITKRTFAAATATALLMASGASAQMWADESAFRSGIGQAGIYDAWDRDGTEGLTDREFATGVFTDWDRDNDMMLTEDEFNIGSERWYGADYDGVYADWDADADGLIDRGEFAANWGRDTFDTWDVDADGLLTRDEWDSGVYGRADADQDMVITIEEEGWFEGWFDGDDIEAEIQSVGDLTD